MSIQHEEQQAKLPIGQMRTTFGDAGTQHYSGYFQEEPNKKWRDHERVKTVEEMRTSDGTIRAVLSSVKTPILNAGHSIEPASEDARDIEIAQFIESQLYNLKFRSINELLKEILTCVEFGHSVFELILDQRLSDGKIALLDVAPRIQSSIERWKLSDGRFGITQNILNDNNTKNGMFIKREIPAGKLAIFTMDKEGDDVTGRSLLRSSYIHWRMKTDIYRIQAVGIERFSLGVPVGTLPEGVGAEEKEAFEEAIQNIYTNEQQYLLLPHEGYKFELVVPNNSGNASYIQEFIDHHDRRILLSVLAEFLDLGATGGGSYALSEDQSSFFLKYVEQLAVYVAEQINKQIIKKLVDYNYDNVSEYPKFVFSSLGELDYDEMSQVIERLTNTGYMNKEDVRIMQFVRRLFKLPELTEDEEVEMKARQKEPTEEPTENQDEEDKLEELAEKKKSGYFRELTEYEDKVKIQFLEQQFDRLESQLEDDLIAVINEELEKSLPQVERKLDDLSQLFLLPILAQTKVYKVIKDYLSRAYSVGKTTASGELEVDRPPNTRQVNNVLNAKATVVAEQMVNEARTVVKDTATEGVAANVAKVAIIAAIADRLRDKLSKQVTNIQSAVVSDGINSGRRFVFEQNITKIIGYQRTEILDSKTCNMCMSLDGRIITPDDPMAKIDDVHFNCRGFWTPVLATEKITQSIGVPKTIRESFDTIGGVPTVNNFKQLKKPINKANESVQDEIKRRLDK